MLRFRSIDQSRILIKDLAAFIDRKDVFSVIVIIFTALGAFFIGKLSYTESSKASLTIERFDLGNPSPIPKSEASSGENGATASLAEPYIKPQNGMYVGSRTSNKYHLPSCPGAMNIADANKIWFATKEDAIKAGYIPAANCKGI